MTEKKTLKFKILGIRELNSSYTNANLNSVDNLDLKLEGKYELNYRWNLEKNLFAIVFTFSYQLNNPDGNKNEIFKLTNMVEFNVENLNQHFTINNNEIFAIDKNLEIALVSVTISTMRGIIYEKTKGTFLNQFVLPLINPEEVILSKKQNIDKNHN